MSVSRRVILSVGILMLLALSVLGYQLWTVTRMQQVNTELSKVTFVAASHLLQMELDVEELEVFSKRYVIRDEEKRKGLDEGLKDRIDRYENRFKQIDEGLQTWEAPGEIALLSTAWIQYKAQLEGTRQMLLKSGLEDLPPSLANATKLLKDQTHSARIAMQKAMAEEVKRNQAMGNQTLSVSLIAVVVFLVAGALITFLTVHAINSPLRELTRGTRSIASGEFSHRLPVHGPSEFADLARDFNSMSEKLGELDRMKKDFVAHVSHELKAPLAAIRQTLAVTLEQIPGPVNDGQRRLLQLSRNSAERLSAMVANLLDVSRLEAGTMEYEMGANDIVAIVRQVIDEFSLKAEERQIQIKLNSEAPSIPVVCDGDRMIQVIGNVVDNALKFSPPNSTIEIEVRHNHTTAASTATVSISDRGHGVPDDHKESVFEKFHQILGRGKRTAGQGVGLGLSICKTIMTAHRGRIWVEDNPGGGSVFRVEMHAAEVKEAAKCG
jgi:two-component system sensor histidine kinase GlrK